MASEKFPKAAIPICQNVSCSKNIHSDRIFWKREIEHQYSFYLATLRAEQDARFLIQEHSDLLREIEWAKATNVELRKEIRLLKTELYVMYQRNAHDSCVIDGLQEADYEVGETDLQESQIRRRIDITAVEVDHEDTLIGMLKNEIAMLQRKDGEDAELIECIKPLEVQLKNILEVEKLRNHQQAMKFKRELTDILEEFQERNSYLETKKSERSLEIMWIVEIFSSVFLRKMVDQDVSAKDDANSTDQETEVFDISVQEKIPDVADMGVDFQLLKEEHSEFIALKELLDTKNTVNLRLIYDFFQRFTEGIKILAEEYLSVFEVSTDVAFIKEYLERLDSMRRKMDGPKINETVIMAAQRLDQLNVIYNILLSEKALLTNSLQYFMSTLREDFEVHCVVLQKTEELFAKIQNET